MKKRGHKFVSVNNYVDPWELKNMFSRAKYKCRECGIGIRSKKIPRISCQEIRGEQAARDIHLEMDSVYPGFPLEPMIMLA